jgi:hypothetical protein
MKAPSIKAVAEEVKDYADHLKTYDPADITEPGCDVPGGDIRLQAVDGSWYVHTGDAQYDTDHHGRWGAGFVPAGASMAACRDIARDLINEIDWAEVDSETD